jgi:hypothetical protein
MVYSIELYVLMDGYCPDKLQIYIIMFLWFGHSYRNYYFNYFVAILKVIINFIIITYQVKANYFRHDFKIDYY